MTMGTSRVRGPIVVTGGGTAGHVLPAIAVLEGLVEQGCAVGDLLYIGAQRGVETRLLPMTPFRHEFLNVVGVQRRFSRSTITYGVKLFAATLRTVGWFRRQRPSVIVSVGGYASMPAVIAAKVVRRPIVVVSYDRIPGRASRLAARWAVASAVAFDDSGLPNARHVGAPLRQAVLKIDRIADASQARERLGVPPNRFLVVVVGGSLGSGVLNDAVQQLLRDRREDTELAIFHVTGARDVWTPDSLVDEHGVWYRRAEFVDDVANLYAAADLLVGRGGASTVHEVAATGTPAVLVPWSGAADDHQRENVRWLAEVGAAVTVDDGDINGILAAIEQLRATPERRSAVSTSARARGEIHHRGGLASLVLSIGS